MQEIKEPGAGLGGQDAARQAKRLGDSSYVQRLHQEFYRGLAEKNLAARQPVSSARAPEVYLCVHSYTSISLLVRMSMHRMLCARVFEFLLLFLWL